MYSDEFLRDMNRYHDLVKQGIYPCAHCWKPMKKVDDYTYVLDCECAKDPKLAGLRLSVG